MHARLAVLSVAAIASLWGCVSLKRTPEARFFALRSQVQAPDAAETPARAALVGILPVVLPGHLERPQVVVWTGPGELRIDEFVRWAEPLDAGIDRVLAESLAILLPGHRVLRSPWPSSTPLRCRARLELTTFGPQPEGQVELTGRWALLPDRSERPVVSRAVSLRRGPVPGGPAPPEPVAAVEAMSQLLAELSAQIADAIRALPPEEEPPGRDEAEHRPMTPEKQ
jgi:uncharacterized lipoprotein YmbA